MSRNLRRLGRAVVVAGVLIGGSGGAAAGAPSGCAALGGTVEPDQVCHVHAATADYVLDVRFPVDYPGQQALTDFVTQQRDDWAGDARAHPPIDQPPYPLTITGTSYRSGSPASGTQSVVLAMSQDLGAHPVGSFRAFNDDLGTGTPITFATLFAPGTHPLPVLSPIVQRALGKRGPVMQSPVDAPGVEAYQNFAITDDAVIFFFDQGQLLPQVDGPQEVSVPRSELAGLLA